MFDIGFAELLILSLVALLVLGPDRLPEALRTLGRWIVTIRRTVGSLQAELEQEIGMDEIRRELHNNRILEEARALERELKTADGATRQELGDLERDLRASSMDPARERRADAPEAPDDESPDESRPPDDAPTLARYPDEVPVNSTPPPRDASRRDD